jgi:tRNA(Ile2) C34 agmatinyltransferase TiaS
MRSGLPKCPGADCSGEFRETGTPNEYECRSCGRRLREAVVDRMGSFERLAKDDDAVGEMARVALKLDGDRG